MKFVVWFPDRETCDKGSYEEAETPLDAAVRVAYSDPRLMRSQGKARLCVVPEDDLDSTPLIFEAAWEMVPGIVVRKLE